MLNENHENANFNMMNLSERELFNSEVKNEY